MRRFLHLFRRPRFDREMDDEIRFHIQEKVDTLVANGMDPGEAKRIARNVFGNMTAIREDSRAEWSFQGLEAVLQDLRYGVRSLRRSPAFTLLALAAMTLGVGAAIAVFLIVNATLLRPLPYENSNRLVVVRDQLVNLGLLEFPMSLGMFEDYREQNQVFDSMAAFQSGSVTLREGDQPERLTQLRVSANLADLLDGRVFAGRNFSPAYNQPGKNTVALLSYPLWQRRFHGEPSVIGRTIVLDDQPYQIIGVLTTGDRFQSADVWVPLAFEPDPERHRGALQVLARLRPGVGVEQANQQMKLLARRLGEQYRLYRGPRGEDAGYTVAVTPLREQLYGKVRRSLWLLLGAALTLLLIPCANVAHLQIARSATRQREFLVRQTLGAGRWRSGRQ